MKLSARKPNQQSHNDSIFETGSPSTRKQKAEQVSRVRLISQSTLGDNSSKNHVQTINNEIATGSRTTDDLLQFSVETAEVSLGVQNQRGVIIAGRNNSTTIEHRPINLQDQSLIMSNSVRKKNLKGLLGDYSSQNTLPQVRDSLAAAAKTQFKKNDPYQQSRSRLELTKKEMQQFQMNGVVSREFIHQNKKELETFIKQQSKIRLEGNPLDSSGNQIMGLQYSTMADGSHPKKEVVLSEEQKLLAGLDPAGFVFSEDVRPDRGFSGQTSQITSRVVENWINQTLTDAEHLDIPSVILKPENKVPITRYGIDRISLTQSGLSSEQVDRIYRGLFVYSVGFYENLKKQIQNCDSNLMLGLQTNLWKTFNVLLEYCCKTDYRLLISKITQQNEEEKLQIVEKYKSLMQIEINEKKMLKQNMLVMQTYQESLEKDRNNERSLRLKLEEEYMQIQRNHEEEVTLRLKFEGKLNSLNTAHRELEIKYERVQQQFDQSLMNQQRLDQQCKVQSEELVALRTRETDQLSQLDILTDFKSTALVEIDKKNKLILSAEEGRKAAADEADIIKYQVQDQDNQTRRLEMRIQDLTVGRMSLENHINTLESQIKDQIDKVAAKQEELEQQRKTYEDLALNHTHVSQDFQIVQVTSDAHIKIINGLREQIEHSQLLFEDHHMHAIVYKAERDELRRELEIYKTDLLKTSEQLREMNKERHNFEDLYNGAARQVVNLENILAQQRIKIESNLETIARQAETINVFKETITKLEEQASKALKERVANEGKLNLKVLQTQDFLGQTTQERNSWMRNAEQMQERLNAKEEEEKQKKEQIKNMGLKEAELENQITDLQERNKMYALSSEQALQQVQSQHKMVSDAVTKQLALEETVRYLTQQKDELLERYRTELRQLRQSYDTQLENAQMKTEEAFSLMVPFSEKLKLLNDAQQKAQQAQVVLMNSEAQTQLLQLTTEQLKQEQQATSELLNQLDQQDTDFDSIIERIMHLEHERFEYNQKVNDETIAQLNEMLLVARSKEAEQNKVILRAEKRLEQFQKTGSVGKQSADLQKTGSVGKQSAEKIPRSNSREDPISQGSQEGSRDRISNQTSNAVKKSSVQSKGQQSKGGRFDQMIKESQEKKSKQEKVNALIMGRQKNQHNQASDTNVELNRTVIPKKNFKQTIQGKEIQGEKQLSHTQDQENSVFKEINQNSTNDLQQNQSFEQDELLESDGDVDDLVEDDQEQEQVIFENEVLQEDAVDEEMALPQRDLQAEKFEEYKAYVLKTDQQFLEMFKDFSIKVKEGKIKEGSQQHKEEMKKIMASNQKLPETFLNMRLTESQKTLLAEEQETQKFNFQVDNEDIFPFDEDQDGSDDQEQEEVEVSKFGQEVRKNPFAGKPVEIGVKKKENKQRLSNIFAQFADNHTKLLEKLVQEHAARVEKAALERRKVQVVDTKVEGQVKGKKKTHYLIKMKQDPNYYELHRNQYLEGIKKAEQDIADREVKQRVVDEEQKRKADEIAKILLERHQRKVAKIEIVREYLQQPQYPLPSTSQIKTEADLIQGETSLPVDFNFEPEIDQVQHLVQQQTTINATEPLKESKRLSPVKQILDAVNSMSNSTLPVDPELQQYIKGGVAGLNRQYNRSSSKRIVTGPSSIRTLIRSVNSRL